ncbi:MAG: hypothetical protein FRX49_07274 [Trebouxia sp. A1-2]|nr:MAG: hypothetical protein FRX49_07274 [Trebouxia sp. A1-2]
MPEGMYNVGVGQPPGQGYLQMGVPSGTTSQSNDPISNGHCPKHIISEKDLRQYKKKFYLECPTPQPAAEKKTVQLGRWVPTWVPMGVYRLGRAASPGNLRPLPAPARRRLGSRRVWGWNPCYKTTRVSWLVV